MKNQDSKKRLQSLDVLRGMTVAGMILVNDGYGDTFAPLQHSVWNGMTPCDLVFPFFLFISPPGHEYLEQQTMTCCSHCHNDFSS